MVKCAIRNSKPVMPRTLFVLALVPAVLVGVHGSLSVMQPLTVTITSAAIVALARICTSTTSTPCVLAGRITWIIYRPSAPNIIGSATRRDGPRMNSTEVGGLLLQKGVPPDGLCAYLARRLLEPGAEPCKHDFKHTGEYVTSYRGIKDPEPIFALLRDAGAHCDCEVGYNVCAEIGE